MIQEPTLDQQAVGQVWRAVELSAASLLAGWLAENVLDSGLRMRGTAIVYGVFGFYLGSWFASTTGFDWGPALAGHALVPILGGAFVTAATAKLIGLGAAGPRR